MASWLKKIFGTAQSRLLSKYKKIVAQVNSYDEQFQALSDENLRAKTAEFKQRHKSGETLNDLLPEAYAVVKNVCRRLSGTEVHVSGYDQLWDMVPYDVQILGAIALHYGAISEMQTGEGKTLTAALPLYLNALTEKPVHLVTVNDYLAGRDSSWVGPIFRWLGLRVAALTNDTPPFARKEIYAADIVYGTASEFGFDYLKDNSMAQNKDEQVQRGHYFAIIDEVDSILIDEARTPLIISGPAQNSRQMYDTLHPPVSDLVKLQRDLCNKTATEARKTLEELQALGEEESVKLNKEEETLYKEALRKLWLVSKGMPSQKILKRIKENPVLRAQLDKWDIYYYAEPNKEERAEALAALFIIVDEKSSDFEITDKGIEAWIANNPGSSSADFTMLDLGYEYSKIDEDLALNDDEKMKRRVQLREEDSLRKERAHNLRQLLRAHLTMEKDVDYIIDEERKIVIIDENTGRPQPGRRFSDGLHQAIEAKEGVSIQGETQTYATITLQNYFRLYTKLAGMTGTAMTEANEFKEIYKLEVIAIPTHRTCKRVDDEDEVYMTEREKYNAILKEVQKIHGQNRPILIGTESVEASEKLSRILKQNKLEHTVLNAKNHAHEAQIIAGAGEAGRITVATNMAGRGTDIKLKKEVADLGGLHVIGTTRHQSRRIDRQLRGRSARQGDPGSSIFFVSFEDPLLRLFTSPNVTALLQKFRPPEGEAIKAKMLSRSIETAQKRVETRNYTIRKHTLEYDDVMNKQRAEIYAFRNDVLHADSSIELALDVLESVATDPLAHASHPFNTLDYKTYLMTHFPLEFPLEILESEHASFDEIARDVSAHVSAAFLEKIARQKHAIDTLKAASTNQEKLPDGEKVLGEICRSVLLRHVDQHWKEHLQQIDYLRSEMQMRSIGQKDPLQEFKHEAFALFDALSKKIREEIVHALFKFEIFVPPKQETQEIEAPSAPKKRPVDSIANDRPRFSLSSINEIEPVRKEEDRPSKIVKFEPATD